RAVESGGDRGGHWGGVLVSGVEPGSHLLLVGERSVLAQLPLSFELLDRDLEPGDRVEGRPDVFLRRVQTPAGRVETTHQVVEDGPQSGLVDQTGPSPDVNHHVIPGGDAGMLQVNGW